LRVEPAALPSHHNSYLQTSLIASVFSLAYLVAQFNFTGLFRAMGAGTFLFLARAESTMKCRAHKTRSAVALLSARFGEALGLGMPMQLRSSKQRECSAAAAANIKRRTYSL